MGTAAPMRRLGRTQRREQIVAAATEAFARAGLAATSPDDVALDARITRAVRYRHFESRSELHHSVLDPMCARKSAYLQIVQIDPDARQS